MTSGIPQYQLHHNVNELHKLFGAMLSDGPSPESCADKLLGNISNMVTTMTINNMNKQKLIANTSMPAEFVLKYEELRAKHPKNFEQCISFFSKLTEDKQTKDLLKRNAELRAARSGPVTADMQTESATRLKSSGRSSTENAKTVQKSKQKNYNAIQKSEWLNQRPYQTLDFVKGDRVFVSTEVPPANSLPELLQEQAVVEDLLCCLQGLDGRYIHAQPLTEMLGQREFIIDSALYLPIRELAKTIIPLCSSFSSISRFIDEKSQFEFGLVNHALCSAIKTQLKDYLLLIGQLEHSFRQGQLALHRLHYYLQMPLKTLNFLASITVSLSRNNCTGAAVLNVLYEKSINLLGDVKNREVCLLLLQQACVPYFDLLEKWIYKGKLNVQNDEFMVEEREVKEKYEGSDAHWEQKHTICKERVPIFLEKVADKILNAGKYLNVVFQCKQHIKYPNARELVYNTNSQQYIEPIEAAYSYASKLLLDLLLNDNALMARLKSVKHYFLLDQGDFIVQFMDMADSELKKPKEEIKISRLESLLELAVRSSTANIDPYKDDLMVSLLPYDLITQLFRVLTIQTKKERKYRVESSDLHLSGLESFTLNYKVQWPLSLVLNNRAIMLYQLLFRHLFYCKHVERLLCAAWIGNKSAKMHAIYSVHWYAQAFALRQQMLCFIQTFQYYMMFEVIEPNWLVFESAVKTAANIDDVLNHHMNFLNSCLQDCMLTNPQLLNVLHKLMAVCVTFVNYLQRLTHSVSAKDDSQLTSLATLQAVPSANNKDQIHSSRAAKKTFLDDIRYTSTDSSMESAVMTSFKNFSRMLTELLNRIANDNIRVGEHKLMNLVNRLDYNGYYTQERLSAEQVSLDQSNMSSLSLLAEEVSPAGRAKQSGHDGKQPESS